MARKRYGGGRLLEALGIKSTGEELTQRSCVERAHQIQKRLEGEDMPDPLKRKARKQAAWYRWRAKQFPAGERRGRSAA